MICERDTGYLPNFTASTLGNPPPSVQLTKSFEEDKAIWRVQNPSKVLLSLIEEFYNLEYNLALDNLYTSPELIKAPFQKRTDVYGTLRKKRRFLGLEACQRYRWTSRVNILWHNLLWDAFEWTKTKTKKIVSMMSTKHTGVAHVSGEILHATKQPNRKPDVIVENNKTMGGVNNFS